jgi:fumarylacetoacetase
MRAGDLLGSGTISGDTEGSYGSLLELSWKGTKAIDLCQSKTIPKASRTFLQDGDRVVMTGHAERHGVRVGFGSVEGVVTPAVSPYFFQ